MNNNNTPRPAPPLSPLQQTLMIGLGICCLLSVSANFLHSDSFEHHSPDTAVARAMKDFKRNALRSKSAAQLSAEAQHAKQITFFKEEHGLVDDAITDALHDPEGQHEEEEETVNVDHIRNPPSTIGSLECSQFGGPFTSEEALDMVYWHDIPSDAEYISPLKAKKGERRQYLTFEPDGGTLIVVADWKCSFVCFGLIDRGCSS
jgi:hypothetical protein